MTMQVEAIKKDKHYEIPELENLNLNKDSIKLYFDYDSYMEDDIESNKQPMAKPGSLQARLNQILGNNVKQRVNVSIGEDRRLYMEALWEKYGQ
jgi:hypothetical protein